MSAFFITCTTCQRRLRVGSSELVGKILACPNCGGMVMVNPPESPAPKMEKHGAPDAAPAHTLTEPPKTVVEPPRPAAETTFETTDVVITESPTDSAPPPATEPANTPSPAEKKGNAADVNDDPLAETIDDITPPAVAPPPPDAPPPETPAAPPSEWASSRTQGVRRIVLMAGLGVFGAVLAIGLLAFVASRNSPPAEQVAGIAPPDAATQPNTPPQRSANTPADEALRPVVENPVVENPVVENPVVENPVVENPRNDTAANETPHQASSDAAAPTDPAASLSRNDPTNPATATEPPPPSTETPPPMKKRETKDLRALDSILDFLDTETPPPSIPAEPAFSGENAALPPTERPLPPPVDVAALLEMKIEQIDFPDTPLLVFLEFIQEMTTAPITVDRRVLAAAGVSPTTPVQVKLADVTVGDVLRTALEPLTLGYVVQDGNILIVSRRESLQEAYDSQTYDIAGLLEENRESRTEFVARIKRLFQPGSWSDEGAYVKINGNQLVVSHTETVQWEAAVLLKQIIRLRRKDASHATPAWAAAVERGRERLAQPLQLNYSQPVLFTTILARLRTMTGVQFLVDWRSAQALGLTPEVEASLLAQNQPCGEALAAMLAPLDLAYRVVDELLVEIVPPEALAQRLRVQVYSVPELTGDAADLEALKQNLVAFLMHLPDDQLARTSAIELDQYNGCIWAYLNEAQHAAFAAEIKSAAKKL